MGTYLMMLYVSLEQEKAVKTLFSSKGWGYKKPDLSLTTDKLGPLTVEETNQTEDEDVGRARAKPAPPRRDASKRTPSSKTISSSPGPKSSKKSPRVKVRLTKGGKSESAEFQEILEEAELITASINQAEEMEETGGSTSIDVKVERESSGDDSDDNMYGELDDEHDEDYDDELEEAEVESTDLSQETSSTSTPRPRKKRKLSGKVKATPGGSDQEAGGDTPVKMSGKGLQEFPHEEANKSNLVEKAFTCDVCGSTYGRKSTLLEHYRLKHTNIPLRFKCEICGKAFVRRKFLVFHLNKHTQHTPYSCSKCFKMYTNSYSKERHEKTCNETSQQQCPKCGKQYVHSQAVLDHIKAEHDNMRHVCVCGKIFKWRTSYSAHAKRCPLVIHNQFSILDIPYTKQAEDDSKNDSVETGGDDFSSVPNISNR